VGLSPTPRALLPRSPRVGQTLGGLPAPLKKFKLYGSQGIFSPAVIPLCYVIVSPKTKNQDLSDAIHPPIIDEGLSGVVFCKSQVNQGLSSVQGKEEDFSHNNNSPIGRAMGGGWEGQREMEEGSIGRVNEEELFSIWRRADFEFCGASSGGGDSGNGIEEGQEDYVDIVELWEEGLFEF